MHDTPAQRKARGAFFTPPELADFLAGWAIRAGADTVLEPSCGDAAFLLPAARRLCALGATAGHLPRQLHGLDIHPASATLAAERLAAAGLGADIAVGSFFDHAPDGRYDAVIGNPPYVRYQHFSGEARAKSALAALAHGVRLTGLASSWAAFTVHAAQCLRPDGRLALVLPAELLTVNYAAQVRRFLLRRFASVRLILFEERVFPEVLEDVVLLLAEGSGGASRFELYQARNPAELERLRCGGWVEFAPHGEQKWTAALLPAAALDSYRALTERSGFATLLDWGETTLGAVTGNNDYFALTAAEVAALGLAEDEVRKISPPGSRHLRGLNFSADDWRRLADEGRRCFLFAPSAEKPSAAARRHIAAGERAGIDQAFKCRNRRPWWRVPLVERPDLLFTYMNHDRPRLSANGAGVHLLNSLYGITLREPQRALGGELLALASLNSATLLGAEIVGRAYGGGMLKHEPREADMLPVPSAATVAAVAGKLRRLRQPVATALRAGDAERAVELVDRVVLETHLGLARPYILDLRRARALLFQRRATRGRGDHGGP